MRKFAKLGCLGVIGVFVLFVILAVVGGGSEDTPSTGNNTDSAKETAATPEEGTKTVNASSQTTTAAGLTVSLGDIKISDDKIEVGMNVSNDNSQAVSFYPDQGQAVIGDMQLDANLFLTDGNVSGDIQPGVTKEGVLEFLAPEGKTIDVSTVKQIQLMFGDAVTEDFMTSDPVSFTVPVQ